MEVHLNPDLKAKLDQLAAETGRSAAELIEAAIAGYLDELAQVRDMLGSRYDDLKSDKVQLIDGAEALAILKEKSEARRVERRG